MSESISHTVTERDVELFGEATGDMNPVHFDEDYARKTVFRGRVAHGALAIGFISAVLGTQLPGAGTHLHVRHHQLQGSGADRRHRHHHLHGARNRRRREVMMDCVCKVGEQGGGGSARRWCWRRAARAAKPERDADLPPFRRCARGAERRRGGDRQFRRRASGPPGPDRRSPRRRPSARRAPLAVLAFEPHPQEFFRPSPDCFRLTPLRTKARLLAELGVDALFALPFDAEMARRSAAGFRADVLVEGLGISGVVVGHDFEFGKGRAGNLATLAYMGEMEGFGVTAFDTVTAARRREDFLHPDPRAAEGRPSPKKRRACWAICWAIEARVEHGDARGRTMGFPTANMHLGHCLAPAFGVYAVRVNILEGDTAVARHDGVANFGIRPMYQVNVPLLETHLFDFDGDLYGKYLSVELMRLYPARSEIRRPAGADRPDRQ